MIMRLLKKFFWIMPVILWLILASPLKASNGSNEVRLFLFHSESCPHCKLELKFVEKLKEKYPNLKVYEYELTKDFRNQSLFRKVTEYYKLDGSVPTNIIGDEPLIGYDDEKGIGAKLEKRIQECSQKDCSSWLDGELGLPALDMKILPEEVKEEAQDINIKEADSVRILGKELSFNQQTSVYGMGMLLGLADGVNPCMFSVLIFLLTYLLAVGSRKRALKAGLAFTITTFLVYFLFMYGIIKVVDVLQISDLLRKVVIAFAFFAGLIMVKDYFFYGKGISLEIPAKAKPLIESLIKKGTVPSAVLLAFFSSIVELPCTSGLPLAYISILSKKELHPFWYLAWYNLFFIVPLLVIILGITFAWAKIENFEEWRQKYKKYMRLAAGVLLLLLAFSLWKNWI
jgi:cytochrome c biogenesis protein CcdA